MWTPTPTISNYESFISSEILSSEKIIKLNSSGQYSVELEFTEPLLKLYILKNWILYRQAGISEKELWLELGSINNAEGSLRFSINGEQINYLNIERLNRRALQNYIIQGNFNKSSIIVILFIICFFSLVCIFIVSIISIINIVKSDKNPQVVTSKFLNNLLTPFSTRR